MKVLFRQAGLMVLLLVFSLAFSIVLAPILESHGADRSIALTATASIGQLIAGSVMLAIAGRSRLLGGPFGWPGLFRNEAALCDLRSRRPALILLSMLSVAFSATVAVAMARYAAFDRWISEMPTPIVVLAVLGLCILTPIAEEFYFRRWMWADFAARWGDRGAGIAVTILFTSVHMLTNPGLGLIILPLSLLLLAARVVTGSVLPGIALHMAHNSFVLFADVLFGPFIRL